MVGPALSLGGEVGGRVGGLVGLGDGLKLGIDGQSSHDRGHDRPTSQGSFGVELSPHQKSFCFLVRVLIQLQPLRPSSLGTSNLNLVSSSHGQSPHDRVHDRAKSDGVDPSFS